MSNVTFNRAYQEPDDQEDDEWLFESIVTYLSSPIWSIPIQHFIETNCSSMQDDFNYFKF